MNDGQTNGQARLVMRPTGQPHNSRARRLICGILAEVRRRYSYVRIVRQLVYVVVVLLLSLYLSS